MCRTSISLRHAHEKKSLHASKLPDWNLTEKVKRWKNEIKMKRKCLISSDDVILSTTSDPDSSMNNSDNFLLFSFFFPRFFRLLSGERNTPFDAVQLRAHRTTESSKLANDMLHTDSNLSPFFFFWDSDAIIEMIIIQRRVGLSRPRKECRMHCRLKSYQKKVVQ